jgi:hypothetical protein
MSTKVLKDPQGQPTCACPVSATFPAAAAAAAAGVLLPSAALTASTGSFASLAPLLLPCFAVRMGYLVLLGFRLRRV